MNSGPDSYSDFERIFLPYWRKGISIIFKPVVSACIFLRLSPNFISFLQIPFAILFFFFLASAPILAFFLFIGSLLLDALDGALARAKKISSPFGAILDQICDYARETIVITTLASAGAIPIVLAVLYPAAYGLFNVILYVCNHAKKPLPFAVKSYLLFYPALFAYLWFGTNILNIGITLSLISMGIGIQVGLYRIRQV